MTQKEEIKNLKNFASWVTEWIFKPDFEENAGAFAELALRKLNKLGYTFKIGKFWFYDGVKINGK